MAEYMSFIIIFVFAVVAGVRFFLKQKASGIKFGFQGMSSAVNGTIRFNGLIMRAVLLFAPIFVLTHANGLKGASFVAMPANRRNSFSGRKAGPIASAGKLSVAVLYKYLSRFHRRFIVGCGSLLYTKCYLAQCEAT